jgi:cold shock CspA family protein
MIRFFTHILTILSEFHTLKGKIARYFAYRGYGFISVEEEDKDVFFHLSNFPKLMMPVIGQTVKFDMIHTSKGLEAHNIQVVGSEQTVEHDNEVHPIESDLNKLSGVGPKYVNLLKRAKVYSIKELSSYIPEILYSNLYAINEERGITKKPPTLSQVENWIKQSSLFL